MPIKFAATCLFDLQSCNSLSRISTFPKPRTFVHIPLELRFIAQTNASHTYIAHTSLTLYFANRRCETHQLLIGDRQRIADVYTRHHKSHSVVGSTFRPVNPSWWSKKTNFTPIGSNGVESHGRIRAHDSHKWKYKKSVHEQPSRADVYFAAWVTNTPRARIFSWNNSKCVCLCSRVYWSPPPTRILHVHTPVATAHVTSVVCSLCCMSQAIQAMQFSERCTWRWRNERICANRVTSLLHLIK